MEVRAEALVIGGGLAGSAAALGLARAGRDVVLVERTAGPEHKVCGEFLSAEALGYLRELGVDVAALGAVAIRQVRMAAGTRVREATLPFAAMSVTRRRLDEALLGCAARAGVRVRRGAAVQGLEREGDGWRATVADGDAVQAERVFVGTGKHDLRGRARPAGVQGGLVGFKMYWRLQAEQRAALGEAVELVLYGGGYGGLQPVEDGLANLCCLVEAQKLRRLGGGWDRLLAWMCAESPLLRERLGGAEAMLERPLAISAIPYGFVRKQAEGLWQLGDQAAVIPSFTGDGMSLALHSGCLAARMYVEGASAQQFTSRLEGEVRGQVRLATAVSMALVKTPRAAMLAARMWPGTLAAVAKRTRIGRGKLLYWKDLEGDGDLGTTGA